MVHIEQGALCTFEQQIRAHAVRIVQLARDIGHHGLEQGCVFHGFVVDGIKLNFAMGHIGQQRIAKNEMVRA